MSGPVRMICRGCISGRLRPRQGYQRTRMQPSLFRMCSRQRMSVWRTSWIQKRWDACLEYRRRTSKVVCIFNGHQIKERELFPLIHTVSTVGCVHDNKPGAVTAGAADAAVEAMDSKRAMWIIWRYVGGQPPEVERRPVSTQVHEAKEKPVEKWRGCREREVAGIASGVRASSYA